MSAIGLFSWQMSSIYGVYIRLACLKDVCIGFLLFLQKSNQG